MNNHGKTGYDAYRAFSDGKSLVSGEPLPEWDALPGNIQEAWNWSTTATRNELRRELGINVPTHGGSPQPKHYPPGMGEESRRLHREYNALVKAQEAGEKNGREVVRLTDEAAAKGIILVPGGENL